MERKPRGDGIGLAVDPPVDGTGPFGLPEGPAACALGLLETIGWTPAILALDAMSKTARIRVLQAELNDRLGVCLKVAGEVAAVQAALAVGYRVAEQSGGRPVISQTARPAPEAWPALDSLPEFNPLIQQDVVTRPRKFRGRDPSNEEFPVSQYALGLIETQGFTAVFEAIDTACKAADVEVVGKEKLGGGYVTVVIRGDVAAVKAAIDAGQARVEGLGTLIAAHVIPRPSEAVLGLLPTI